MGDERWRLFVAIGLGEEARQAVVAAQATLQRASGETAALRWVAPEGAHLTLKFLGEVERSRVAAIEGATRAAVTGHAPFDLHTAAPGAFPNPRRPRVLWLGLAGELAALARLQGSVETALHGLGFPREERPFRPHLTLARLREGVRPPDLTGALMAAGNLGAAPLPVCEALLMRSELGRGGARYTHLIAAPLGGARRE